MTEPAGALAGTSAFTEHVLSIGEPLELEPGTIERLMQACDKLADDMDALARSARNRLGVDTFGLGEKDPHLKSAQQLAEKFRSKAIGGGDTDDANTAVGLFKAHQAYALEMKEMLRRVLDAYTVQESANMVHLKGIGL